MDWRLRTHGQPRAGQVDQRLQQAAGAAQEPMHGKRQRVDDEPEGLRQLKKNKPS